MSSKFRLYFLLGALAVMGLAACILVPDGGGRDRGEHEDRDHHDREGDHRHDFGLEQRERFGLNALPNEERIAEFVAVAVYVPPPGVARVRPLWA